MNDGAIPVEWQAEDPEPLNALRLLSPPGTQIASIVEGKSEHREQVDTRVERKKEEEM